MPSLSPLSRRRPVLGVILVLCAVALGTISVRDAAAHHPVPSTGEYAVPVEDTTDPGGAPKSGWDAKDEETCAYNRHHSGYDAGGNPLNGHQAIQLLNQDRVEGDEYPLFRRLKNGGIEVAPIFNCLPNFWGWVIYREENGLKQFVVDKDSNDGRIVASESGFALHSSNYYHAKPQHERSYFNNTVGFPESAELMSEVGYGRLGTSTPMLRPAGLDSNDGHAVFKYNSQWWNGDNRIQLSVPVISGKHSVTSAEKLYLKIWTAESIEKRSTVGPNPNPFSDETNLHYGHQRT